MTIMLAIFFVSLLICLYVYFAYPVILWVISRIRHRPVNCAPHQPVLSVIIPVFNEASVIEAKIRNTLASNYPRDRMEVIVVSDGSTDETLSIAQRLAFAQVRLLSLPRVGKGIALNAGVAAARGEAVVFTDANSLLHPDSLSALAENFTDPEVGGVCGHKKYRGAVGDSVQQGEGLYWRYEQWQKKLESRIGNVYAADGTLFAIRRELYVAIEDAAQADDIAVSCRIPLQGKRLVFEPRALVVEEPPTHAAAEFSRKIRVTNHSVRALLALGRPLWTSGFYSFELISHKLLRHLVPFFLPLLLLSSFALAIHYDFVLLFLVLQVLFYLLAAAGHVLREDRHGRSPLFAVPYYFTLVNAAAFFGVLSILRGTRLQAWTPRGGLT